MVMEDGPPHAARRTPPGGYARVAAVVAGLLVACLATLPPLGFDALVVPLGAPAPASEEGGSEPEAASAAARAAHATPAGVGSPAARPSRPPRPVSRTSARTRHAPGGFRPTPTHLRC